MTKTELLRSRWTNKQGGAIELAEEQCQALNEINSSLVESALDQFLTEQDEVRRGKATPPTDLEELIIAYQNGDHQAFQSNLFSIF